MLASKNFIPPIPSIPSLRPSSLLPQSNLRFCSLSCKTLKTQSRFNLFAQNNNRDNNNNGGLNPEEKDPKPEEQKNGDEKRNGGQPLLNIKWSDLLFDPDPDNLVAVGLAGLLTWASVQVLGQLFFISLAILVAALKYSFIAALLLFILITLL